MTDFVKDLTWPFEPIQPIVTLISSTWDTGSEVVWPPGGPSVVAFRGTRIFNQLRVQVELKYMRPYAWYPCYKVDIDGWSGPPSDKWDGIIDETFCINAPADFEWHAETRDYILPVRGSLIGKKEFKFKVKVNIMAPGAYSDEQGGGHSSHWVEEKPYADERVFTAWLLAPPLELVKVYSKTLKDHFIQFQDAYYKRLTTRKTGKKSRKG